MKDELNKSFDLLIKKLLNWMNSIIENLPNLILAFLVLLIAYFLANYISKLTLKLIGNRVKQKSVSTIIARLTTVVIVMVGLFLALGILNLSQTITSLITGAGVLGLVIGLALQGTLSNIISGIVISFREKIQIGNWIETNGFTGEIIDINLKNLTLKESDNNLVMIPNKIILENPMKNYSLTPYIRVDLSCGVGYESDLEFVEKLTKDTLEKTFEKIDESKPVEFFYTEFGDSSINFRCRFWIKGTKRVHTLNATNKAIIAIKKAFDKEGINIPFPIRTLQFGNTLDLEKNTLENGS
ncbi:mechanosensitive ion channel family protein [Gelidibacter japonicus]|jgi:small conductance mechanosensitive channel|uniref:mechanosensitive ion channel family protein n=1 Tax=Gelidibacter japonicus TaxID=1962232 RepID=UPI0013D254B5|nr:mechanosensitive ion channel family protein [Gelidibacter japonicus]MCL8006175.1 mechanosensitive ion channel family protein [Gelidibacter japonicus]